MPNWTVEGFQSGKPTEYSCRVTGGENKVTLLLVRLVARHLTDHEVTDATFGGRKDLIVHRDKQPGRPLVLMTAGTDFYYTVRIEEKNAQRS